MNLNNMTERDALQLLDTEFGIHFGGGYQPILANSNFEFKEKANQLVGDVDTYTYNQPSSGVPAYFTMVNINKVVEQLLPVRRYKEIGGPMQYGDFTTNLVQYTSIAPIGQVGLYGDYTSDPTSDINETFPTIEVYRGQTVVQYGELETAVLAKAKIDAVSRKQIAAATNIAIAQNKLFFFGNISAQGSFVTRLYGLTNNPQLNASIPATNGTSGSPLWSVKAANVATGANDIAQDVIVTAMTAMNAQTGGNANLNMRFKLIVPTNAMAYMNATNSFGLNAIAIIKHTLPNIEIISVPEFNTMGIFMLIAPNPDGSDAVADLFTYMLRGHNLVPSLSSKRQKWSFGSAGAAIFQFTGIVTVSGITV